MRVLLLDRNEAYAERFAQYLGRQGDIQVSLCNDLDICKKMLSEELFQVLKFSDPDIVRRILDGVTLGGKPCHNCKMTAKSYERSCRRPDWGNMVIDAMKYCLMQKYAQCEPFRQALADSIGRTIVEDQTSFSKRHADAWGVKRQGDTFVGPNLLGRLLMELRDNGTLSYRLPDDALSAIRGCLDA